MDCASRRVTTRPDSRSSARCWESADWLSSSRAFKFAHGEWPAEEIAQDQQALLVADRLEHTRRLARVQLHLVDAREIE